MEAASNELAKEEGFRHIENILNTMEQASNQRINQMEDSLTKKFSEIETRLHIF